MDHHNRGREREVHMIEQDPSDDNGDTLGGDSIIAGNPGRRPRNYIFCKFRAMDDDSHHFGDKLLAIDAAREWIATVAEVREEIKLQFTDVPEWKIDSTIFLKPWPIREEDIEKAEEPNIKMMDIREVRRSSGTQDDPISLMVRREVHHTYFELDWIEDWNDDDENPTVVVESQVAVDMTLADLRREIDSQINLLGVETIHITDYWFWGTNNDKKIEKSKEGELSATKENIRLPSRNRRETRPPTYSVRLMTSSEPIPCPEEEAKAAV